MPLFEFDIEAFTSLRIEAESETAARQAVDAVLKALRDSEYAIGEARCTSGEGKSRGRIGRPPIARRKLGAMLALKAQGLSARAIAERLGVDRGSVYRALKWAAGQAANLPR